MKTICVAAAVTAAALASAAVPSSAAVGGQYSQGSSYSRSGGAWADRTIERAFQEALRRTPDESEYRRYRVRVFEDHWSQADIVDDLRGRQDYWGHNDRMSRGGSSYDIDRTIRAAYQDILGRQPDGEGLRHYRDLMMNDGWTERQLREALRKSPEHTTNPTASADRVIQRAYRDLLNREPDFNGLSNFRNQIVNQGWDEHDVRQAIMNSPEYRQKGTMMNDDAARQVVRRAYLSVLGREPDPASAPFVQKVLREHWTERDVARELRNSEEFRNRQQ